MAKVTPATISYFTDSGKEVKMRFHTVISEAHSASNSVTKFPVQTGFEVSNHAIRKNREVNIEGMITNTLLEGSGMTQWSPTNNIKEAFAALEALVLSATPCKVVTNLGVYEPVVFTKFNTTTKEGLTDAMSFTISGEEVQIARLAVSTAPKPLSFVKLSKSEYEEMKIRWAEAGLPVSPTATYSKADVELGSDFSIDNHTTSGAVVTTTYICKGYNPATGGYSYEQHNTVEPVASIETPDAPGLSIPTAADLLGGVTGMTNCLADGALNIGLQELGKFVDSAVGKVTSSAYGAKQAITTMGGSQLAQSMIGMAIDCSFVETAKVVGYETDATTAEGVVHDSLGSLSATAQELSANSSDSVSGFIKTPTTITQAVQPPGPLSVQGILGGIL